MDRKAETGVITGCGVAALVLGVPPGSKSLVTLSTAEGGDAEKLKPYHHKQLRNRVERQLGFQGLEYYQVGTEEGHGVLHIFWAWRVPDGNRLAGSGSPGMALVPVAEEEPSTGPGGLDQGLSAQPSFQELSQPVRHQPIRPGSMRAT